MLNIFYEEPDSDRWVMFDRYPRRLVRRLWRGRARPGGQKRIFLNLCAGLDRIGVRYRVNDYQHARRNPRQLACIIGKPNVLDNMEWQNPILFGTAVFSHPSEDPQLFERLPVKRVLLPGPWMKEMWRAHWDAAVAVWPVGIDTDRWRGADKARKIFDVLLYDKVRWERTYYESHLIEPIRRKLRDASRTFREIRYGFYDEEQFQSALAECRTMIFLCEHETQGIAYQQALASDVPILAWDRGGYWRDPHLYPHRVQFAPVTSVPYWDERCGRTFASMAEFDGGWTQFWDACQSGRYGPRAFILDNLTLEQCARHYVQHASELAEA
jgi:glycosyltransferase involved in cell wall biosynthesis